MGQIELCEGYRPYVDSVEEEKQWDLFLKQVEGNRWAMVHCAGRGEERSSYEKENLKAALRHLSRQRYFLGSGRERMEKMVGATICYAANNCRNNAVLAVSMSGFASFMGGMVVFGGVAKGVDVLLRLSKAGAAASEFWVLAPAGVAGVGTIALLFFTLSIGARRLLQASEFDRMAEEIVRGAPLPGAELSGGGVIDAGSPAPDGGVTPVNSFTAFGSPFTIHNF